jgi:hypothetical protein
MNLSERFAQNQGEPIELDGRLVQPIYRRRVAPDERIRIALARFRPNPVQGVRAKLQSGNVQIDNGPEPLADVVLWTDTAPRSVVLRCITKKHTELRIWNCWRDEHGVMQAWIGNAAMEITEEGSSARIRCNSGNAITFEDLVMQVETIG